MTVFYHNIVFLPTSVCNAEIQVKLIERTNKMQPCSRIYYSNVLNCSTCFGWHTAHHQELKNCNCSLWFYICFWLPAAVMAEPSQWPATINVCKTRGITVFELLMISGVLTETCWAIKKHWNNKFYYTVASCWFFLWILCYNARIHEHQIQVKVMQLGLTVNGTVVADKDKIKNFV